MTLLNPKWYESNFIKNVSEITNSGPAVDDKIKQRIFDRNEELRYFSIGLTTGSRSIFWTTQKTVTINRFFIQNCNWEDFIIEWFDSSAFLTKQFSPVLIETGNADKNLYFEVAEVTIDPGDTVRFIVNKIIGGGPGEATVAEIYIGAELFGLPADRIGSTGLDLAPQVSQKLFDLSDGTSQKIFVRKTVNYNLPLSNVSEADKVDFENLYERNRRETFVFVPRPVIFGTGKWDGLGNHYNWANANDFLSFTANNFANGFDVNIVMLQAGGLD
jgi:hypothetical protein